MLYTVKLKQLLVKDVVVEAVSMQDAMAQALASADTVIDTDDITTEVASVTFFNKEVK